MNIRTSPPPRSRHAMIADSLANDIQAGIYKIGARLPSEAELSAAFGVSRHTVRVALRTLQTVGLVLSQQGVGSIVQRDQVVSRYIHSFNSAADLLQYAASTRTKLLDRTALVVDAARARDLGCKANERWWRIRTLRFTAGGAKPVAYSEIDIPFAFGAVLSGVQNSKRPIFSLIQERFQQSIVEIRQEICAITLPAEIALLLKVPETSPGLEISRRYIGKSGKVLEAARSIHPSESFKYSMDVQLRYEM